MDDLRRNLRIVRLESGSASLARFTVLAACRKERHGLRIAVRRSAVCARAFCRRGPWVAIVALCSGVRGGGPMPAAAGVSGPADL